MSTYKTMTTEHLGVAADDDDLNRFKALCAARQRATGETDEDVTDWAYARPDLWLPVECAYCGADVIQDDVPAPGDDEAWALAAVGHSPDCEWVVTRAHWLDHVAQTAPAASGESA